EETGVENVGPHDFEMRMSVRKPLLLFPSVFFNKLRDSFVIFCDPFHYGLGFGVFHLIGNSACRSRSSTCLASLSSNSSSRAVDLRASSPRRTSPSTIWRWRLTWSLPSAMCLSARARWSLRIRRFTPCNARKLRNDPFVEHLELPMRVAAGAIVRR